jgi:hypothetical protein
VGTAYDESNASDGHVADEGACVAARCHAHDARHHGLRVCARTASGGREGERERRGGGGRRQQAAGGHRGPSVPATSELISPHACYVNTRRRRVTRCRSSRQRRQDGGRDRPRHDIRTKQPGTRMPMSTFSGKAVTSTEHACQQRSTRVSGA